MTKFGRRILVAGSFVFFHEGHKQLLVKARKIIGDGRVTVAVNGDRMFEFYRGFKPEEDEMTRLKAIRDSGLADESFIVPEFSDYRDVLIDYNPSLVLHGTDWTGDSLYSNFGVDRDFLIKHNILFVYVDTEPNISSTMIREGK